MSAPVTKVILVVGAIILFVLLFIAPKIVDPKGEPVQMGPAAGKAEVSINATLDVYLDLAAKNLEADQKQVLDRLLTAKKQDSAAVFWDQLKRPDLAAYYTEEAAINDKTAKAWFKAGNRYYYAVQFSRDQTEIPVLYQGALRCFNNGLKLDPSDTDARIMQATCYVEGTQDPMAGVSRLREIEKTDSNNVKLQLTFAFFSVKSGQLDKAIKRFNKVIEIDSTYIEAYLHLADVYERQGKTKETITSLEKYASMTGDATEKMEISKYVQQLKQQQ
ncbi:MAG TPA: tetratricopeptide repeat protein [Bacteroidia bacterium]|nr:tetratricopeptide repeat protein [Bacteroidia bacterium]